MTDTPECACPGRRRLLGSAAALGLGAPLLAACGGASGNGSSGNGSSDSGSSASGGGSPGTSLIGTADVPVGSGVILSDQKVVVTQPSQGDFKGFSAVCTHLGCIVSNVSGDTISCPCHGSQFSIKDGSVLAGPAPKPLPPVAVKVKGTEVVEA